MTQAADLKIVLIGGASHVGKSTLCDALGSRPGWSKQSTDKLGRHPGRPWRPSGEKVRPHVVEHYLSLTTEELVDDVLCHQRRMWPTIERIVAHRLADEHAPRLAFQGSAMLPENTGQLFHDRVKPLCLAAKSEFLTQRIRTNSGYDTATIETRRLVDKFCERNHVLNELYIDMAKRTGVQVVDVGGGASIKELVELSLRPVNLH